MKQFMTLILLLFISGTYGQSKTYYVSPGGNDSHTGLSQKNAWKTIEKVNLHSFQPGDAILFRSDGIWKGQLKPRGSGISGKPITIGSYGEGSKPVIDLGAASGAAVRLVNQEWWNIQDLEITSGAQPLINCGRQGIVALAEGAGNYVRHITVRNCYIHDIWGQLGGEGNYTGYNSAAIYMGNPMDMNVDGGMADDILVENNRIERVDKCGIIVWKGRNKIVIRKNFIENTGGDGIMVCGGYRALVEGNVAKRTCMRSGDPNLPGGKDFWPHTAAIWLIDCVESVMQFNEVYDTGRQAGNGDGEAYDFDFNCKKCILQYNYSRNNHGFLLIMNKTFENIARYNISENDQTHLIQMQCDTTERNLIHNNVFYVDYGTIDIDYYFGEKGEKDKSRIGANFRNNIFYATGQGRFRTVYTHGSALERQYNDSVKLLPAPGTLFLHNCYFGPWMNGLPHDPEKLEADPLFVAPGSGGEGLSTLTGYKLRPGSPCINAGKPVKDQGNRDFYGNPLNDHASDIGAYERMAE